MRRELHVRFWEGAGVRFPCATRLVRSIKQECLDRLIPIGEWHFRRAVAEYVKHYHGERNHQGLDNRLISGPPVINMTSRVRRRPRVGGCSTSMSGRRDRRVAREMEHYAMPLAVAASATNAWSRS
jgi:hypothetical protein